MTKNFSPTPHSLDWACLGFKRLPANCIQSLGGTAVSQHSLRVKWAQSDSLHSGALAMTCRVCTSPIFTLYCLTKCTYCMSSCSLKHTDRETLAALLSLVSSFHQFTPPLGSLHTGGRPLWHLFNHTSNRSLIQILYQTITGQKNT